MSQLSKYAQDYFDNYLSQALANQKAAQANPAVKAQPLAPPPVSPYDFTDSKNAVQDTIALGGDKAATVGLLGGMTGMLEGYQQGLAQKQQNDRMAQALASGDPMMIAQAGDLELAKTMLTKKHNDDTLLHEVLSGEINRGLKREELEGTRKYQNDSLAAKNRANEISQGHNDWQEELQKKQFLVNIKQDEAKARLETGKALGLKDADLAAYLRDPNVAADIKNKFLRSGSKLPSSVRRTALGK